MDAELLQFDRELMKSKKRKKAKPRVEPDAKPDEKPDTYHDMLKLIYERIDTDQRGTLKLPIPKLDVTPTRTEWLNFNQFCTLLHRDEKHMLTFFLTELGAQGSVQSPRMLINGKFRVEQVESLLKKYIAEYVVCRMCYSSDTALNRDQKLRMHFIECNKCGASRSTIEVKSGFHAVSKSDRKAARELIK